MNFNFSKFKDGSIFIENKSKWAQSKNYSNTENIALFVFPRLIC